MGEVAVTIVKWTIRIGIIVSLAIAFVVLFNFIISLITVTLNLYVVADLMAILQMWLPFNVNVVFAWLFTAASLYLAYRLAMFAAGLVNKFVGDA